jgi:Transposase DDE domain
VEQQLIRLYLHVCRAYDTQPDLKFQRLSNFRPRFTDEELLTIYLFGHMQGFYQQRRIYDYTRRHWRAWFPALPSYQAFNRRLNQLAPAFEHLITASLASQVAELAPHADRLIDSLPISLAKWPRSGAARIARDVASQGYSATKRSYYYGVKLHTVALRRTNRLPLPAFLHLSRASEHDLTVLRQLNPDLGTGVLFGDKAYADEETKRELRERGTHLMTPYKRKRNEPETAVPALWSRFASSFRQPLESLFGWLIQRTNLQNASLVRSTKGLFVHVYGKLAVACLLLTFNS